MSLPRVDGRLIRLLLTLGYVQNRNLILSSFNVLALRNFRIFGGPAFAESELRNVLKTNQDGSKEPELFPR